MSGLNVVKPNERTKLGKGKELREKIAPCSFCIEANLPCVPLEMPSTFHNGVLQESVPNRGFSGRFYGVIQCLL